MSTKSHSHINNDWNDSLANLLGKNVKIFFKTLVRLETRGDKTKTENRVLVFCSSRMFILSVKIPARVEAHYHYLEIEALESRQPNHLCFQFDADTKPLSLLIGDESEGGARVIGSVCALAGALSRLCPGSPLSHIISKVSVPGALEAAERGISNTIASGPCGGFSAQYAAACDLLQVPFREDVAWDIDTMYHTHNQRILMLRDFEHLEPKELSALVCALQYNRWFRGVCGTGENGGAPLSLIAGALRRGGLRELRWPRAALRHDGATRLAPSISAAASLHTIDLTENPIEDKGAIIIVNALASNEAGLKHICLSKCGITGKAANSLGTMLCENMNNLETLTHLDLSHNNLKDDIHDLCSFLAQPNVLTHLNLSNTDITLENVFGALLRGCGAKLRWLSLAGNPWSARRANRDPPPSLRQFFTACLSLDHLDLSHCRLPQDALKNVLLGLACNEAAAGLNLVLRGVLASGGPLVLESCLPGVRCLTHLDLSENCIEGELAGVMLAAGKSKSLRGLTIARLQGRRQSATPIVQALVDVVQDPESVLSSLDISDCKLKTTLLPLLGALGAARGLTRLDVSGNAVGDAGARLLARALRLNTSLRHLTLDRNHLTHKGIAEVAHALQYNRTLQKMEFPVADVVAGGRVALERMEPLWRQLDDHLLRNASADVFPISSSYGEEVNNCVLPPTPIPRLLDAATDMLHSGIVHHMQACVDAAREQVNTSGMMGSSIAQRMAPPRSAVHRILSRALHPLAAQLTEACNAVVRSLYEEVEGGDMLDRIDVDSALRRLRPAPFPPPPLPPHAHTAATPLGGRRISEASGSFGERPQSATGGPPARSSPDSLADLPSNHHQLHHLVKGRPRRTKTRAPSRPVPESHHHPATDGVEVFWRGRASPSSPRSSPTSPTSPTSLTLHNDDTMYSLTSGESTPVPLDERSEADVKRTHSAESPSLSTHAPATEPTVNNIANTTSPAVENENECKLNHQISTDGSPCITEGVEDCVGGSIMGISPAALTGSMRKEAPLAIETA
ncbi:capping protein regulator and myosin 1 linker 1 leucine rich repeat protein isoform X2 [Arctopsyche grandis]|uniref:capping protein regulator and myosin 1 linker 1 leucine rich repeat protein isoform X2 n=1 Tax=Arctopsyche grandis TaxID=121162 RepID=UPI00406D897D